MRPQYKNEENFNVKYFNLYERNNAKVSFNHKGQLVNQNKVPINAKGIFVLSPNNQLYFSSNESKINLHHSSFLAGSDVLFAGEMTIKNGKVDKISNKSGHYKTKLISFNHLLKVLYENGANLENVKIRSEEINYIIKVGTSSILLGLSIYMLHAHDDEKK